MSKFIQIILLSVLLASCGAKKQTISVSEATNKASNSEIVTKHYANATDFKTANIRTTVKFKDKKLDQSASADIRIEKDQKIVVIVRFLGITFVKALITPDRVSYYDSINGQYFDGDYKILSNWLGVDLDYTKVQNILLGKSIYDLNNQTFLTALDNGLHKIKLKTADGLVNELFFEDANYLLMKTTLNQPSLNRNVSIDYQNYTTTNGIFLPGVLNILAQQKEDISINVKYNSVSFNENISFKYEIPAGYEQITIEEE